MSLKPYQLSEIPINLVNIYQDLEDWIIEDVSRRIAKVGKITDTAEWQLIRAQEFGMAQETLKKKIKDTTKLTNAEIDKLFKEAMLTSIEQDNVLYEQAKLTPMHYNQSEELKEYLKAAVKQTKGELKNISRTLGFVNTRGGKKINEKLSQAYINTMDFVQMQVSSGVCDYNTAIRNAVKNLAKSGIRTIDYSTGWHNRVDVAVRRATLTGVNQMAIQQTTFMHNRIVPENEQYVEVTAHAGARPEHAKWQGKVYKIVGSTKDYPNFAKTTGYGTGEGLGGWNCRHSFFPFVPGASVQTYTEEQLNNIDPPPFKYKGKNYTYYEATQQQRKMETQIRATKREIIGYKAIGDEEAFTTASIKLQQQKKEYKAFSNTAGIRAKNERTWVNGFDKSISQKSAWANKKAPNGVEKEKPIKKLATYEVKLNKNITTNLDKDMQESINTGINIFNNFYSPSFKNLSEIKYNGKTKKSYACQKLSYDGRRIVQSIEVSSIMKTKEKAESYIARDLKSNFHYKGTAPETVIVHEMSHMLNYNIAIDKLKIDLNNATRNEWDSLIREADKIASDVKKKSIEKLGFDYYSKEALNSMKELGRYAFVNDKEFFAEALSEGLCVGETDIGKAVIEVVKEMLGIV